MKKILAFSGSNSANSINQQLVEYIASPDISDEITIVNFRNYDLPIYNIDIENSKGIPKQAYEIKELLDSYEGFVIAVPEYNSSISSFFKNIIDWLSRIEKGFFRGKPIVLLSATPGNSGGKGVLPEVEKIVSGYLRGKVVGKLGFPRFFRTFEKKDDQIVLLDDELKQKLHDLIKTIINSVAEIENK